MIQILNNQIDSLKFILSEFVKAHKSDDSIYENDINVAENILLKLDRQTK